MTDSESATPTPPGKLTLAASAPRTGGPGAGSPATNRPQMPARLKNPPLTLRQWLGRILLFCLLLGSGGLLFWSHRQLIPVQRQARDTGALISRLSTEVAVMEGKYSAAEIAQLAEDYRQAQGLLFATPDALKDWFQEVRSQMVPLALDAVADFGRATTTNAADRTLAIVPATLALSIQPADKIEAVRSPYERVLRFLDQLNRQAKRVDLVEIQVTGGTNSVSRAVATLQLWAGEEGLP